MHPADPSSNPFLPAIIILVVVVLLLIICVVLLVLALAVTATKLNKLRADKGYNDQTHYCNQRGRGEGDTTKRIYDEVGEGAGHSEGQSGFYQELELGKMEEKQYESLNKDTIARA